MAAPLAAELKVMAATERRVLRQLSIAYSGISKDLARLESKHGVGAKVERAQLREMRAAISSQMSTMWLGVGHEVRAGRIAAAGAAGANLGEALDVFRSAGLSASEVAGMKASMEQAARGNVEAALKRIQGRSYIPLSTRVYATSVAANSRLQDVINSQLLRGANWQNLARAVREHIRPDVAGGVPHAAKRLARTEINNAFHATSVDIMKREPFVDAVEWSLSGSHRVPDQCNEYADQSHYNGGEPGIFRNGDVPERPHPQCLCFVSAVDIGRDAFLDRFKSGQMDPWLEEEGFGVEDLETKKAEAGPAITGSAVTRIATTPKPPRTRFSDWEGDAKELSQARDQFQSDPIMRELARVQGYDVNPSVITEAELRGRPVMYRGISSADMDRHYTSEELAERFVSGEYFAGRGMYGNGTYTTFDKSVTANYTAGDGTLIRMVLKEDARVIEINDLKKMIYELSFKPENQAIVSAIGRDPGQFAILLGYDAIEIKDLGFINVLNRGAVEVIR